MSREIKFRAWDLKNNEMKSGNMGLFMFVGTGSLGWNFADNWDIGVTSDFILMQYTGLKDKNGKECYEEDIILIDGDKHRIWFDDLEFLYGGVNKEWDDYAGNMPYSFEIIGNIYENPDLLT